MVVPTTPFFNFPAGKGQTVVARKPAATSPTASPQAISKTGSMYRTLADRRAAPPTESPGKADRLAVETADLPARVLWP